MTTTSCTRRGAARSSGPAATSAAPRRRSWRWCGSGARPMTPTAELARAVRAGDRRALARAITLVESTRADHRDDAVALLEELLPATGAAPRVGISGAPGAGKSTFIETLGVHLVDAGHRVAVLAVDPSSARSGG